MVALREFRVAPFLHPNRLLNLIPPWVGSIDCSSAVQYWIQSVCESSCEMRCLLYILFKLKFRLRSISWKNIDKCLSNVKKSQIISTLVILVSKIYYHHKRKKCKTGIISALKVLWSMINKSIVALDVAQYSVSILFLHTRVYKFLLIFLVWKYL